MAVDGMAMRSLAMDNGAWLRWNSETRTTTLTQAYAALRDALNYRYGRVRRYVSRTRHGFSLQRSYLNVIGIYLRTIPLSGARYHGDPTTGYLAYRAFERIDNG